MPFPTDISTTGGVDIAIDTLKNAINSDKTDVAKVLLPADCFCTEFSVNGKALMSTLVDQNYDKGITVKDLSARMFDRTLIVKRPSSQLIVESNQDENNQLDLRRPKLESDT